KPTKRGARPKRFCARSRSQTRVEKRAPQRMRPRTRGRLAMSREPSVLLIDNFDSFAFNLVDAFAQLGARVLVYRNDIGADAALALCARHGIDLVVLSPGPGAPESAGCCIDLVRRAAHRVP